MPIRLSLLVSALLVLSCGSKSTAKFDASKSTVTVDKTSATANDVEEISVTIKTVGDDGAAYAVDSATISVTGTGNTIAQPQGASNGSTVGRMRSTKAETKTISVSVKADGADVTLPQTQEVTFAPGEVNSIEFTTQPTNVQVGAAMTPAIVVTAYDNHGNVAPGEALTIALRVTGTNVPNLDGGVGVTDGGVVVFDSVTFDGPDTALGMQARCQGCSQPWATDATATFDVTP